MAAKLEPIESIVGRINDNLMAREVEVALKLRKVTENGRTLYHILSADRGIVLASYLHREQARKALGLLSEFVRLL